MTEQSGAQTTISHRYDQEIDLAELIFITMDRKNVKNEDIFKFLNALFLDSVNLSEFIPLNKETQAIHKEVRDMCDISDWKYEIGIEEGRAEGREEGREGIIFTYLKHSVTPKMTSTDIISMLCNSFGLSQNEAEVYYEKYSAQTK